MTPTPPAGTKPAAPNTAGVNQFIRGGAMPADAQKSAQGGDTPTPSDLGSLAAAVVQARYALQVATQAGDQDGIGHAQDNLTAVETHTVSQLPGDNQDGDPHKAVSDWLKPLIED